MQEFKEILLQNGYKKADQRFIKEQPETKENDSISHVAVIAKDSIVLAGFRDNGDLDAYNTGWIYPTPGELLILLRLFSV